MKKTYELNYGNKATLNTGNYENLSPMFNIKEIIETESEIDIPKEFANMKQIVETELAKSIKEIKQSLMQKDLANIRFYEKDGKKYVSVTSIINFDKELKDIPNLELYALKGTLGHKVLAKYIEESIVDTNFSNYDKQLAAIGGFDLKMGWIFKDERLVFNKSEQEVFNDEHLYAGRYDANGTFSNDIVLFDLKSGNLTPKNTDEAFMQLSAYAKCLNDITGLVILPCHSKSKQEPIVTNDINKYFNMFLAKRQAFKDKYGL